MNRSKIVACIDAAFADILAGRFESAREHTRKAIAEVDGRPCIDCGLSADVDQLLSNQGRCDPCRRAWDLKMRELGGAE